MKLFSMAMNGSLNTSTLNSAFPSSNPGAVAKFYEKADQSGNPLTAAEAKQDGFIAVDPQNAIWHRQGEGNEYNLKMVHSDGREAVYNKEGKLVTDSLNLGSKNTFQYNDFPLGTLGHIGFDAFPYIPLGNTPQDSPGLEGMSNRLNTLSNPPPIPDDYYDHWKEFYPQSKSEN